MKVITGAAGFIGSCIVAKLNEMGESDLILVDHLEDQKMPEESSDPKVMNLKEKEYVKYLDKKDFIEFVRNENMSPDVQKESHSPESSPTYTRDEDKRLDDKIDCVVHMGACSSTTLQDEEYFQENNYQYTLDLARWCLARDVRFIYASSAATYGDGSVGYKDDNETSRLCKPLNMYGESKQKFDEWVLDNEVEDKVVGLKFFNVFGPNEYHKGDMKSVIAKAYRKVDDEGSIDLFKSYNSEYADGEQKRDFIYVKDAVDIVVFFIKNAQINGIYNAGTGEAKSWNDLAHALFAAVGCKGKINYVDMPENLHKRYQYFTQADMSKIKQSGYSKPMCSLEDAILDYSNYLKQKSCW